MGLSFTAVASPCLCHHEVLRVGREGSDLWLWLAGLDMFPLQWDSQLSVPPCSVVGGLPRHGICLSVWVGCLLQDGHKQDALDLISGAYRWEKAACCHCFAHFLQVQLA
jgi:hypothetical protein